METPSFTGTACSTCGEPLNAGGSCLICLLRGAMPDTAAQGPPPPSEYGDFEIARREDGALWELGRGAMGVTYKAVDRVLHRMVALKVIQFRGGGVADDTARDALRERFLREARAAASLRHANVAGVFQFGVSDDAARCYCAMELVEGETLDARVRREGPLKVGEALELARQVAAALVAAAGRGLIHRDLKPGNLMLTRGDDPAAGLEVKVIDFGLAKAAAMEERDLTDGGFVGTLAFASPEQFARQAVDARSDLYSLGITLWYALTGTVPFVGHTREELRDHPAREHLPVEQLTARGVPGAVIALLRRLLSVSPDGRPASARELVGALDACRAQLAVGRTRAVVRLVVASALLLAAVGGVWWWQHVRAFSDRQPAGAAAASVSDKSLAVLPFDNFSEDKDSAFFADGVQDEVLTDLARVADLKVISRTSVLPYKDPARRGNLREIGEALGVAYVLEGSVQRAGNRIRVNAQLIDARTDAHLWAEHYERDLTDVFAIQSEIARAVAGQLRAIILPQEQAALDEVPTHDEQAYQLYLRALALANDPDLIYDPDRNVPTIDLLRRATALDPGFSRAFVLLAEVQSLNYIQTTVPADGEALRATAETVARLRPGSADADVAMACYDYQVRRDYVRAHEEFTAAARLSPNDARTIFYLGMIERRQGRWQEAKEHLRRATELDPENDNYFHLRCALLAGLRLYPEVLTLMDRRLASRRATPGLHVHKAITLLDWKADTRAAREELDLIPPGADPDGAAIRQLLRCDTYDRDFAAAMRDVAAFPSGENAWPSRAFAEGDLAIYRGDARAAAAFYAEARPLVEETVGVHPKDYVDLGILAEVDARLGHEDLALEEVRRMKSLATPNDAFDAPNVAYLQARVLVLVGNREEAIRTLQTICGQPFGPTYGDLRCSPCWDSLRGDPRFEAVLASLAPKP